MQLTGQLSAQVPQPMHFSGSIVYTIVFLRSDAKNASVFFGYFYFTTNKRNVKPFLKKSDEKPDFTYGFVGKLSRK